MRIRELMRKRPEFTIGLAGAALGALAGAALGDTPEDRTELALLGSLVGFGLANRASGRNVIGEPLTQRRQQAATRQSTSSINLRTIAGDIFTAALFVSIPTIFILGILEDATFTTKAIVAVCSTAAFLRLCVFTGSCSHGVWQGDHGRCVRCAEDKRNAQLISESIDFHLIEVSRIRTGLAVTRGALGRLNPFDFEEDVARLYKALGYDAETTRRTGDEGKDVIARRGSETLYIECKRFEKPVGRPVLQKLVGALPADGTARGVVVTNSGFSAEAIKYAEQRGIELVDGERYAMLWARFISDQPVSDARVRCHKCGSIAIFPLDPGILSKASCACGTVLEHPLVFDKRLREVPNWQRSIAARHHLSRGESLTSSLGGQIKTGLSSEGKLTPEELTDDSE